MTEASPRTFEENLAELERIVEGLDRGSLSLEEALAAFERGVALVRALHTTLSGAEQRVDVLTRDAAGAVRVEAMSRESEDE